MIKRNEHKEQVAVFNWAKMQEKKYPQLKNMYAIPNGGLRNLKVAANLKKEGVKAGVPDISLDYPMGSFHGLKIEMKVGKNKPTEKQLDWMNRLKEAGYKVLVCYSSLEAIKEIKGYLKITP